MTLEKRLWCHTGRTPRTSATGCCMAQGSVRLELRPEVNMRPHEAPVEYVA